MRPQIRIRPRHKKFSYYKRKGRRYARHITLDALQQDLVIQYLGLIDIAVRGRCVTVEADDARQIAAEALCRAIPRYRPELGEIEPYLIAIMRHALIDHAREGGFIRHRLEQHERLDYKAWRKTRPISIEDVSFPTGGGPFEAVDPKTMPRPRERSEWNDGFWQVVDTLSDRSRTIIHMIVEGHTHPEIGAALGLCGSRVSQLLPGVLEHLKCLLRKAGLEGGP